MSTIWLNIKLFYVLSILFAIIFALQKSSEAVRVRIADNIYIGSETKVLNDHKILSFTGIPYAEPPLRELRFKKPLPIKRKGTFEATEWPKACPQLNTKINQSEDCLYLNVWTKDLSDSRPVMVWFHGGGFSTGAAQNGQILAAVGDVVVVTVNYRLGALGFLYTDRDDAPGNQGLWDQVLALEWINDNINYFGGNRKQITVFGFSAGSRAISLHLLSRHSRQLFRNAIMMSGSALSSLSNTDPTYVARIYLKLAQHVGCLVDGNTITDSVMSCLRELPYEQLVNSQHSREVLESNFAYFPNIIFNDDFTGGHPKKLLASSDRKKKINLLVGTTEDEGSWILNRVDENRFPLSTTPSITLTKQMASNQLQDILNGLKTDALIDSHTIARYYLEILPDNNTDLFLKTMGVALGDLFVTCPALRYADMIYKSDPKHNKIYLYYWTYKSNTLCGQWAGACHGSDVEPALGISYGTTDTDSRISMSFMKTLAYFATNNQPPPQDGIDWPKVYDIDGQTITPYYEYSIDIKNYTNFDIGLKTIECEKVFSNEKLFN